MMETDEKAHTWHIPVEASYSDFVFSRAVVDSWAIEMEIFFDEISHFLTRFGNLEQFNWLK